MMKKLLLVSSFKAVASELPKLEKELHGKTITFIPTASRVETVTFYVKAGKRALRQLGLEIDEVDLSAASPIEIEQKLRKNDYIYVTGGNSFFLLQELKKSGAAQVILDEINQGKLYIGESAGAIVLAESIAYIAGMDRPQKAPELTSFAGLHVVDFYPLPHYQTAPFSKITQKMMADFGQQLKLCPMNNRQGIFVQGNRCNVFSVAKKTK